MDALTALTVIGTVASVGGAGVAIWQAGLSKSAASRAEDARDELIERRETAELAQLQVVFKKALRSMEKYGPGSVPTSISGVSQANDAADVQELIIVLREHRAHFGTSFMNEADALCGRITPLLDEFAKAAVEELRNRGGRVFLELSTFSAVIKKRLDKKRESKQ